MARRVEAGQIPQTPDASCLDDKTLKIDQDSQVLFSNTHKKRTASSHPHRGDQSVGNSFFDGSYFLSDSKGKFHSKATDSSHRLLSYSIPKWSLVFNTTLIVLDVVMTLLATAIVLFFDADAYANLRGYGSSPERLNEFLILICVAWLVSLASQHIYHRHAMGEGYELYSKILNATIVDFVIICMFSYIFKLNIPRLLTIFIPLCSCVLELLERWIMRRSLHHHRRKDVYMYDTVIVGSPEGIHKVIAQLKENPGMGYKPIAVCPVVSVSDSAENQNSPDAQQLVSVPFSATCPEEKNLRILPMDSHLPQKAKELGSQAIVIADVMSRYSETMRTFSLAVESMGIELAFMANVADIASSQLHLRSNPSMPMLTARLPQYSTLTRVLKRMFDIVGSTFAIIISSPVMAFVAIRVKAQDGGPAMYSQQRIGLYGKPFTLYKFRSMRVNADKYDEEVAEETGNTHGILFKAEDDPRITKFGRFIRKTSLDEFPQFFNVFKGDMSLVGPRPQQQYEVDQYGSLYSARLLVKPGITGPWQISGRNSLSQEESEQLDISYVENWSFTGDIAILLKTVIAVFRGTGV
ncbi:sugar transferase [Bifidobacterium sp. ESL0728]|uniref:sugar transferase n=1 Tax=Bifidobacterium sp. ESL0728 TaxID=2983220 RepID=UPI0023F93DD6|nr:sugar transferase [Bifidobacterium sp. ESL0728]WEV59323.1 sugar transferase [Bifidobacterium sp. ESL0728]